MSRRALRIVMISSEVESLARTGGLGDVVEALSRALAEEGEHVLVVTPLYGVTRMPSRVRRWSGTVDARVGWGPNDARSIGVVELEETLTKRGGSRRVCLVDDPGLFARDGIYGDAAGTFGDNDLRFATLSRAALEIARRAWEPALPDVIHAHDWHAALAILYARTTMGDAWANVPSAFTIHNLAYQGVLGFEALDRLAVPRELYTDDILAHGGGVNLMKGAIALANRVTTVSPTYAREIQSAANGFGLDAHLRKHAGKLTGILNGIDMVRFDPANDAGIACMYNATIAREGKRACKAALLAELGLDASSDAPLFASVSRLTWQKGIDLVCDVLPGLVDRGARVALVGLGDHALEQDIVRAEQRWPGRVAARVAFDERLARRVYAGSDFFLVPSRFEPCGLTQMYAMRYGSIPIVTPVGGLVDTVPPVDRVHASGAGVVAHEVSASALYAACEEALALFADPRAMAAAVARAMERDDGWASSANAYAALFEGLVPVA